MKTDITFDTLALMLLEQIKRERGEEPEYKSIVVIANTLSKVKDVEVAATVECIKRAALVKLGHAYEPVEIDDAVAGAIIAQILPLVNPDLYTLMWYAYIQSGWEAYVLAMPQEYEATAYAAAVHFNKSLKETRQ